MSTEIRQLASSGDKITADLLRDFLLTALRHDALRDALMEKAVAGIEHEFASDQIRFGVVGFELQVLISELVSAAEPDDWKALAELLIEDTRGELEEIGRLEQ